MKRFIDDDGREFVCVPVAVAARLARPLRAAINENKRNGIRTAADVLAVVEDFEHASVGSRAAAVAEQGNGGNGSHVDDAGPMLPPNMSTAEAAQLINRTDRTVRDLINAGQLDAERVKGDWRVFNASATAYLEQRGSR